MATSGEHSKRITDSTCAYERAHGDPIGKPCFHCGESIPHRWRDSLSDPERFPYREAFTVHHKDYDNSNNAPEHLVPSHQRCNSGDRSPEGMARIEAAQQAKLAGRKIPAETLAKRRAAWTPERRALSAAWLAKSRRIRSSGRNRHIELTRAGALASHQLHPGHEGRARVP